MPNIDRLDSLANIPGLQSEFDIIIKRLKEVKGSISEITKLESFVKQSTSLKDLNTATDKLNKLKVDSVKIEKELIEIQKRKEIAAEKAAKRELAELKLSEARQKAEEKRLALEEKRILAQNQVGGTIKNEEQAQKAVQAQKDLDQAQIEAAKSAEYLKQQEEELAAAIESASNAGNQRTELKSAATISDNDVENVFEYADSLEELTGTLDQNLALNEQYKTDLVDVNKAIKDLTSGNTGLKKGTAEYNKELFSLYARQRTLKKDQQDLNRTIGNQIKLNNEAKGSVQALQARYALLVQQIERLNATQKASPLGQSLIKEAATLKQTISTSRSALGNFTENVGNYSSAVVGFGKKAFGAIRTIANILPGLGISGLLLAAYTGIKAVLEEFDILGSKVAASQKSIAEATKEANKEIGQNVGELQSLVKISGDVSLSINERRKATEKIQEINKENNERTGEHNKLLIDQNGILVQNQVALDRLSESLIRQAKTKAVLNKIEEAYSNLLDKQQQKLSESTSTFQDVFNSVKGFLTNGPIVGGSVGIAEGQLKAYNKQLNDAKENLAGLESFLNSGLNDGSLSLDGIFTSGSQTSSGSKTKRALDERKKFIFEYLKSVLEDQAAFSKRLADDEDEDYGVRYQALQKYLLRKQQLIELDFEYEKDAAKRKAEEQKKGQDAEGRLIIERNLVEELKNIELKKELALTAIIEDGYNIRNKISNRRIEDAKKMADEELEIQKRLNEEKVKAEASFREAFKKAVEKGIQESFDRDKKYFSDRKALINSINSELENLVKTFGASFFEKQKNKIQEEIDGLNEKRQAEIAAVSASVLSEEQKAAKITEINARVDAEEKRLEKEKRKRAVDQARFEKALNIAAIIQETSLAVVRALGSKPYGPQNIALATLTGILGLARLTSAVATVIPAYKLGTPVGGHPSDGPALVGDGYRSEGITFPDGSKMISPNTPTVMNLPKGTIVDPNISTAAALKLPVAGQKVSESYNFDKGVSKIVSAINKKAEIRIKNTSNWDILVKRGSNYSKLI